MKLLLLHGARCVITCSNYLDTCRQAHCNRPVSRRCKGEIDQHWPGRCHKEEVNLCPGTGKGEIHLYPNAAKRKLIQLYPGGVNKLFNQPLSRRCTEKQNQPVLDPMQHNGIDSQTLPV